jgi:hypothetical protein
MAMHAFCEIQSATLYFFTSATSDMTFKYAVGLEKANKIADTAAKRLGQVALGLKS